MVLRGGWCIMKYNSSIIILMILFLTSGCSNDPSPTSTQLTNQSNEEESWAFEYIIYNDRI
jgi:PBP1b-binding outer membrane lipoprotein LpoB